MSQELSPAERPKRADARRNQEAVLEAAAAEFLVAGVEAPLRDIAARAGVGTATIYRHYPTRADLVTAVYRHQVEALAAAGPDLLAASATPYAALSAWIDLFIDFLVTKHGLAALLQAGCFDPLHDWFLAQLVPVCGALLDAAVNAGEIRRGAEPLDLMRGVGDLCVRVDRDANYDPRGLVSLLIAGLR